MGKFCSQCGSKLNEGAMFCPNCGTAVNQNGAQNQVNNQAQQINNQQQNYNNGTQTGMQKTNGLAVASLVCSLVGLFIFPLIFGILAVCFSVVGKRRILEFNEKGKGMATAGLVIGILDIIWWFICFVLACAGISLISRYFMF